MSVGSRWREEGDQESVVVLKKVSRVPRDSVDVVSETGKLLCCTKTNIDWEALVANLGRKEHLAMTLRANGHMPHVTALSLLTWAVSGKTSQHDWLAQLHIGYRLHRK